MIYILDSYTAVFAVRSLIETNTAKRVCLKRIHSLWQQRLCMFDRRNLLLF